MINLCDNIVNLPDKLYFPLPAHVFDLLFSYNRVIAILAELVIYKSVQEISGRKGLWIELAFVLVNPSNEVICNPGIKSWSRISHNVYGKVLLPHAAILPKKDSGQAGMTPTQKPVEPFFEAAKTCDLNTLRNISGL